MDPQVTVYKKSHSEVILSGSLPGNVGQLSTSCALRGALVRLGVNTSMIRQHSPASGHDGT